MQFEDWWIDRLLEPLLSGKTDAVSPAIASTTAPEIVGYGQSLTPKLTIKWNQKQNGLFETAILPGDALSFQEQCLTTSADLRRVLKHGVMKM